MTIFHPNILALHHMNEYLPNYYNKMKMRII